jgi:hypothetical protein
MKLVTLKFLGYITIDCAGSCYFWKHRQIFVRISEYHGYINRIIINKIVTTDVQGSSISFWKLQSKLSENISKCTKLKHYEFFDLSQSHSLSTQDLFKIFTDSLIPSSP